MQRGLSKKLNFLRKSKGSDKRKSHEAPYCSIFSHVPPFPGFFRPIPREGKEVQNSPWNGFLCPYLGNCYSFLVGGNRSRLGLSLKVNNHPTSGHPKAVWWPLGMFKPKVDSKNAGQKRKNQGPLRKKEEFLIQKRAELGS